MATLRIHARKGNRTTTFTESAWLHMGKQKNGWEQITEEEANNPTSTKAAPLKSVANDLDYAQVIEQAKGFEADGKYAEALERYIAANSLKPSSHLKGKITKLTKELAKAPSEFESAVKDADEAFERGEFVVAFELYGTADGLQAGDAHVTARLTECEAKL